MIAKQVKLLSVTIAEFEPVKEKHVRLIRIYREDMNRPREGDLCWKPVFGKDNIIKGIVISRPMWKRHDYFTPQLHHPEFCVFIVDNPGKVYDFR